MSKVTLNPIDNLEAQTSAETALNQNFEALSEALDNTLSRDGTSPNGLTANLDMNGFQLINLGEPMTDYSAVRLIDLRQTNGALTPSVLAAINAAPAAATAAAASAAQAASYVGAATQAPKLSTPRNISYTGAATGSAYFDGSSDISINLTLSPGQALANLGYTPANVAGDNFIGPITVSNQRVVRVVSGTGANSGLISWGTADPTGTPDDGQIYFKLSS